MNCQNCQQKDSEIWNLKMEIQRLKAEIWDLRLKNILPETKKTVNEAQQSKNNKEKNT